MCIRDRPSHRASAVDTGDVLRCRLHDPVGRWVSIEPRRGRRALQTVARRRRRVETTGHGRLVPVDEAHIVDLLLHLLQPLISMPWRHLPCTWQDDKRQQPRLPGQISQMERYGQMQYRQMLSNASVTHWRFIVEAVVFLSSVVYCCSRLTDRSLNAGERSSGQQRKMRRCFAVGTNAVACADLAFNDYF